MKNDGRWLANYEALKAHVLETGHFPNKHDKRLNWAKFQMKKIKAGTLEPERQRLFEELMAMRSGYQKVFIRVWSIREDGAGRRTITIRYRHDDDDFFANRNMPNIPQFKQKQCIKRLKLPSFLHKRYGKMRKIVLMCDFILVNTNTLCNFAI